MSTRPKRGKVAVLDKPKGKFVIKEYPLPDPVKGTLLLKIEVCGICGTDVHTYQGHSIDIDFPVILGHEFTGRIVALGNGVKTDFLRKPVKVGDRVAVVPSVHCGDCYFCNIAKTPSKCVNMLSYGCLPEKKPYFTGGYGEYLYACYPPIRFFKASAPPEVAMFTEPLSIAVHGVERAGIRPGDTVVIQGLGAIGLLTIICAQLAGATKIIAVGRRRKARLELAKRLGASVTISMEEIPDQEERIRIIKEASISGYGAEAVFECAGVPSAVSEGIEYVRGSGTLCEMGHFTDTGWVEINPCRNILTKNISIEGIYDFDIEHFVRAISILENTDFPFGDIISHKLPLDRIQEAMEALTRGKPIDGKEVVKVAIAPES